MDSVYGILRTRGTPIRPCRLIAAYLDEPADSPTSIREAIEFMFPQKTKSKRKTIDARRAEAVLSVFALFRGLKAVLVDGGFPRVNDWSKWLERFRSKYFPFVSTKAIAAVELNGETVLTDSRTAFATSTEARRELILLTNDVNIEQERDRLLRNLETLRVSKNLVVDDPRDASAVAGALLGYPATLGRVSDYYSLGDRIIVRLEVTLDDSTTVCVWGYGVPGNEPTRSFTHVWRRRRLALLCEEFTDVQSALIRISPIDLRRGMAGA